MTTRDKAELRIVEVNKPLAARKVARPKPRVRRHAAPTIAETLGVLRGMHGAAPLFERTPELGLIGNWSEVAYWDICKFSGAAVDGTFVWDCDFPGVIWTTFDGDANCIAYFAGAEPLEDLIPPQELSGQVWCYINAPRDGLYVFSAQVLTYTDDYYGPDYVAIIECCIDDMVLGNRTLVPGVATPQGFLIGMSAGYHRFLIRQVQGAVFFESLTAWLTDRTIWHAPMARETA